MHVILTRTAIQKTLVTCYKKLHGTWSTLSKVFDIPQLVATVVMVSLCPIRVEITISQDAPFVSKHQGQERDQENLPHPLLPKHRWQHERDVQRIGIAMPGPQCEVHFPPKHVASQKCDPSLGKLRHWQCEQAPPSHSLFFQILQVIRSKETLCPAMAPKAPTHL